MQSAKIFSYFYINIINYVQLNFAELYFFIKSPTTLDIFFWINVAKLNLLKFVIVVGIKHKSPFNKYNK